MHEPIANAIKNNF